MSLFLFDFAFSAMINLLMLMVTLMVATLVTIIVAMVTTNIFTALQTTLVLGAKSSKLKLLLLLEQGFMCSYVRQRDLVKW